MADLYIVVFPKLERFKLGWASDSGIRIQALERAWGAPDYDESFRIIGVQKSKVLKLEKLLHFLLTDHHAPFEEGEGKTEFFKLEGLSVALEGIEFFYNKINELPPIQKGIPKIERPHIRKKTLRTGKKPFKESLNQINKTKIYRSTMIDQFHYAARLLNILKRKHHRINMYVDLIDQYHAKLFFYIPDSTTVPEVPFLSINSAYYAHDRHIGRGLVSSTEFFQEPQILIVNLELSNTSDAVINAYWDDLMTLLKHLPKYSSKEAQGVFGNNLNTLD